MHQFVSGESHLYHHVSLRKRSHQQTIALTSKSYRRTNTSLRLIPDNIECSQIAVMSLNDFNEIKVFDDKLDNMDIIRNIIDEENQEDGFYILDIGDVIEKHCEWIKKIPKVVPHFAVKCNPDPTVIKILAALNAGFDCASEEEIKQVMQYGVHPDRIIYANPYKSPSHLKYAKKMGVKQLTADSEFELLKIRDLYPEAKVVIRVRCDAKKSGVDLGLKFGCESEEAVQLIRITMDLGLTLHGFSFHVGSPCGELNAYSRGIAMCRKLIAIAKAMGCKDVQLIDIGGGFPGNKGTDINKLAILINDAIKDLDPGIRVISEPGTYYVASAFTLAAYLHSKRIVHKKDKNIRMYYVNVGAYNSFVEELLGLKARVPQILCETQRNNEKFLSSIWGPTCDSYDAIVQNVQLPELHFGDWLIWEDMGAYTLSICTTFNGFPIPAVVPIMRKSQWEKLLTLIKSFQKSTEFIEWSKSMERENYIESR